MIIALLVLSNFSGYIYSQNTAVIDSLNNLLILAEESGDSLEISRANFKLGRYHSYNNLDTSNYYLNRALDYAKGIKYDRAIGLISNIIASNYSDQGRHDDALKLYDETVLYFENAGLLYQKAAVLMNIGLELATVGRYPEAIKKQLTALDVLIESGDSTNIANFYCEIGILFDRIGNSEKHREYLEEAYRLSEIEKYANIYTRTNITNELAFLHKAEGNIVEAEKLYLAMYDECKEHNYYGGVSTALLNLAGIEKKKKNYNSAKDYLLEGLKTNPDALKLGEKINIIASLGEVYFNLNKISTAKKHLLKAIELAEENQYPEELKKVHKILFNIYKSSNNFRRAFEHHAKYISLKDSLENLAVKDLFAEMETKFNVQQKEKKIELLNKENTLKSEQLKNQWILLVGITITVLLSGVALFWYFRNKRIKAELSALQYKQSMLRSQLNPHFIFNSLNTIQNFILKNKSFESADYLSDFARLMRLTLESSREDFIPLENEISLIRDYIKLQQLRFEHRFNFSFEIEESLDTENMLLPGMLLQPFVENSIEHGLKDCEPGNGFINIKVHTEEDKLLLKITDNGEGINKLKSSSERTSYSTRITEERIENILSMHDYKIDFEILSNKDEGTTVIFEMEILTKEV